MRPRNTQILFLSILILAVSNKPAWAYLDPGTGSMILQGLIAVVAGAVLLLKMYWAKVKSFFSSRQVRSSAENERADEELSADRE